MLLSPAYAEILLPLALESSYTYRIPEELIPLAIFGKRVEVQFGSRKRYAGLITKVSSNAPDYRTKEIISVLDNEPVIFEWQYSFWKWMAAYYCCTLGEVMKAALPGAYLLSSETIIRSLPVKEDEILQLDNPLYDLMRIIQSKESITLADLEKTSGLKILYPHVVTLYKLGMIVVIEELAEKYIPRKIKMIGIGSEFSNEDGLHKALDLVAKNENQTNTLLSYLSLAGKDKVTVEPKELLAKANASSAVLKSLIKKGILVEITKEVNRMDRYKGEELPVEMELDPLQKNELKRIRDLWLEKDVVLLHGVTGSGKTIIYSEIIEEVISEGGQVLYLVPEIGLSVQILTRLRQRFGNRITISHSRLNDNERVDLWNEVSN